MFLQILLLMALQKLATAYCGLCTTGSEHRSISSVMLVFSSLKHTQEVSKVKFVEAFSLNFEL